jgi:hypothetical protein
VFLDLMTPKGYYGNMPGGMPDFEVVLPPVGRRGLGACRNKHQRPIGNSACIWSHVLAGLVARAPKRLTLLGAQSGTRAAVSAMTNGMLRQR